MRLKLTIAYDGAAYAGWQSQAHGKAAQDVLEAALVKIVGSRVVVHGAGRTDAGVHALAQTAHIDVSEKLTPVEWLRALNANIPPTLRITACRKVADSFHARFSAQGKIYRYLVRNEDVLPPLELGRVWHFVHELDEELLKKTAALFVGRHDFGAFAANRGKPGEDTVRTIHRIQVTRRGSLIALTFQGEGFLYKMVRMLSAVIVKVAQGREDIAAVEKRLATGAPKWSHVAPAEGLYLAKVLY